MMIKSIRWRLQLWYGVILVFVLAGFGLAASQLQRGRLFQQLDGELQRRMAEITGALRQPMRRDLNPEDFPPGPMPGRPPRREGGPPFERPPQGREPLGQAGGPPPGPGRDEDRPLRFPPSEFRLPPRQAALFDEADTNGFYYVLWRRDGLELARSSNAPPNLKRPAATGAAQPAHRSRGIFREVFHATPPGEIILTGRSMAPELGELRRTTGLLSGAGGIVLILGLAGGWWLATRAIRPVEAISETAVKIAAGDLSQRINSAETESELGRLAGVLNSTFARLETSFAQQKQFTSDAAHELRTPVSVVLTQTQTALNRERSAAEYRETVEACQRAAHRMRKLIESLLELARLDAGQEQMNRMPFDLSQTAKDCVELVRPLSAERGIALQCDLPPLPCVGDSDRLSQVITNLLTNAVHYNKEKGEIRLTGEARNGSVALVVADTGPGIAPADLPHVFERFYRADKSRTAGRSGLGLAISKAIIEAHGGTIKAASEVEVGTTFTIWLPAEKVER